MGWWGWLTKAVEHVKDCKPGMVKDHAWAGKTHDFFHARAQWFAIAMDRAFCAGRFPFLIRAAIEALLGILKELFALRAKLVALGMMEVMTVEADHGGDGLEFAVESGTVLEEVFRVGLGFCLLDFCVHGREIYYRGLFFQITCDYLKGREKKRATSVHVALRRKRSYFSTIQMFRYWTGLP